MLSAHLIPEAVSSMRLTTPLPNTKLANIVNSPAIPVHSMDTHTMRLMCTLCVWCADLTQEVFGASLPQTAELVVDIDDCQTVDHCQ